MNYLLEFATYGSDGWLPAQSYSTEDEARRGYDAAIAAMKNNDPAVDGWRGVRMIHPPQQQFTRSDHVVNY